MMRFALILRNRNAGPGIHLGYHKNRADAETARATITVLLGLARDHDMYLEIENVAPEEVA